MIFEALKIVVWRPLHKADVEITERRPCIITKDLLHVAICSIIPIIIVELYM